MTSAAAGSSEQSAVAGRGAGGRGTAGRGTAGQGGDGKPGGRRFGLLAAVVGLLLVAVIVAGRPRNQGQPLDPAGEGRAGGKGLVLLLGEIGGRVSVSAATPSSATQTVVLLQDTLDEERTEAVEAWVRQGGTLVVTDPASSLADAEVDGPDAAGLGVGDLTDTDEPRTLHPGCNLAALAGADTVKVAAAAAFFPGSGPSRGGSRLTRCYPTDDGRAYLVARAEGRGTVVALAGAGPFTNRHLDDVDHAVLAVNLLVPSPGTRVQVLSDFAPDATASPGGDKSVWAALSRRWQVALLQLVAVLIAVALWRARRLGRPVPEDQPVRLAGSDLVAAVSGLYQAGGRRQQAAANLVADARRTLADRLGLPPTIAPDVLARVAAANTNLPVETVMAAVAPASVPATDADLLTLAQRVASVQQEIARAR